MRKSAPHKILVRPLAFTLIETLVVLTIIGILFGVGMVNYRDYSRRQVLSGVVSQVRGDLRLAQQMALQGKKPTTCPLLDAIGFYIIDSGNYEILAYCTDTATNLPLAGVVVKGPSKLPGNGNVIFSSLPSPNPIKFKVLGQGTNIDLSPATIGLQMINPLNNASIKIASGGKIE